MQEVYSTETVNGFVQLFVVRRHREQIVLIIAKVVDHFLMAGSVEEMNRFHDQLSKLFKVGRFICDQDIVFNRPPIHQEPDCSVHISMDEYLSKISTIDLDSNRRKNPDGRFTPQEKETFLRLAGQLNWLGHGVLLQAAYVASLLQQWTSELKIRDIIDANKALQELRKLKPSLLYRSSSIQELSDPSSSLMPFTDASQGKKSYGQTEYLVGLHNERSQIFHLLDWHSSKQKRVSYSSGGGEILAAAESSDRSYLLKFGLQEFYRLMNPLPVIVNTDSDGIYSKITALHEGKDFRLRPTVSRLRDS